MSRRRARAGGAEILVERPVAKGPEREPLGVACHATRRVDQGDRDIEAVEILPAVSQRPPVRDAAANPVALDESLADAETGSSATHELPVARGHDQETAGAKHTGHLSERSSAGDLPMRMRKGVPDTEDGIEAGRPPLSVELFPSADRGRQIDPAVACELSRPIDHRPARVGCDDVEPPQAQTHGQLADPGCAVQHPGPGVEPVDNPTERLNAPLRPQERLGHQPLIHPRKRPVWLLCPRATRIGWLA